MPLTNDDAAFSPVFLGKYVATQLEQEKPSIGANTLESRWFQETPLSFPFLLHDQTINSIERGPHSSPEENRDRSKLQDTQKMTTAATKIVQGSHHRATHEPSYAIASSEKSVC